jgi:hypothetical protein
MIRGGVTRWVLFSLAFASAVAHADSIISNGNLQQGLTGWTPFTTANGTLGPAEPQVAPFSPDGVNTYDAAQVEVGQAAQSSVVDLEGGGIFQTIALPGGGVQISVNVAAQGGTSANLYGGFAQLLIDAQPVAGYDFGALQAGEIKIATLSVDELIASGNHTIAVEFTRPATVDAGSPFQYAYQFQGLVDAPEPSTFLIGGLSLLLLVYCGKRKR